MVKYSCDRCGKKFSQKSHYDSHKRRKTPCVNNADKIKQLVDKAVEEKMKWLQPYLRMTSSKVMPLTTLLLKYMAGSVMENSIVVSAAK